MTRPASDADLRGRLLQRLADLDAAEVAASDDTRPIELDQTAVGRLSRMDSLQVQAMSAASQRMRTIERLRLRGALQRLDDGDYGWCVACGEAIAPERLDIDPALPTCVACAGKRE